MNDAPYNAPIRFSKVAGNVSYILRNGGGALLQIAFIWTALRVLGLVALGIDEESFVVALVSVVQFIALPVFWLAILNCCIAAYLGEEQTLTDYVTSSIQVYRQSVLLILPGLIIGLMLAGFVLPTFYVLAVVVLLLAILVAERPPLSLWPIRLGALLQGQIAAFLIGAFLFGMVALLFLLGTQDAITETGKIETLNQAISQTVRNIFLHVVTLLVGAAVYAELRNIEAGV